MNPRTPNAQRNRVRDEVRDIMDAWPTAMIRWTVDHLAAVLIIHDPLSTYIIEVDPEGTRSLWVSHHAPIGEAYTPEWTEGWVD